MNEWWAGLGGTEQFLWGLALFSTAFFLVQTVMTIVAGGLDADTDADMFGDGDMGGADHGHAGDHGDHGASFLGQYFTIRNMVAFFLGFSWGGLAFLELGLGTPLVVGLATLVGLIFVAVVMGIMRGLSGLRHSGTLSLDNAVGVTGTVSISIPREMGGEGKVSLVVQGRLMDLNAVTGGPELRVGAAIRVTGLVGNKLAVKAATEERT
ncbi:MAG: hypothetical protein ABIK09_01405 [Pseudomonadota bacterium]